MHQVKRNVMIQKSFYEELDQVFDYFPKYYITIFFEILMQNWGERISSNLSLGMRVYVRK
jgi:hypothetical protein